MTPKTSRHLHATRLLSGLVALASLCLTATAQNDQSQYDRGTPPQHAAGVSALGSYTSADIGTINLSNGALNFRLPLGSVGGRGFWLPLTLNYTSKVWSGHRGQVFVSDPAPGHTEPTAYAYYNDGTEDAYNAVAPGWTVGAAPFLKARGVGIGSHHNSGNGCTDFNWVVVKLTLVLPDKGEIELRDRNREGAPAQPGFDGDGCKVQDSGRGKFWHSTDGSGVFFINDNSDGVLSGDVAGTVITADGTRYHFVNTNSGSPQASAYVKSIGRCDWVRDRNGNKILINYPTATRVEYVDQLGRTTIVESNVTDPDPPHAPLALLVTLPGYNGTVHYYKVKTATMNQNYRIGTNPALPVTVGGDGGSGTVLFSGYPGVDTRIDTLSVVTQLVLPDGRALTFKYNEFGEVNEVQMTTNGKVQYDYTAVLATGSTGLPSGNSLVQEVVAVGSVTNGNVHAVDRAVTARRTYADGSTLEGTWSYSYKSDKTELKCVSGSNTLVDEWHYFLPAQRFLTGTGGTGPDGTGYSKWSTGVENRSEMVDTNGTTVLSATQQDWFQRKTIQAEGKWTTGYTVEEIANDNRVTETRKYLDDGSYSRVDTLYDQSLGDNNHINNPVQVDEYDLDHTTLKRETRTIYFTGGNFAGTGVNNLNILTLPAEQDVYDAGDLVNPKSQTIYEYDNYTADANNLALQTYSDYSSIPGRTHSPETAFDTGYTQRGNATKVTRMIDSSTSIASYTRYDVLGNVVSIKDPKTNVSTISYLDDFGAGSNPGLNTGGHSTYALPTKLTSPAPNAGESPHIAYAQYDFSAGLLSGFKDRNGTITQTFYNDAFDRPTQIRAALGTTLENHTVMYYAPQTNPFVTLTSNDVLMAKDQASIDDGTLRSWTHTDGFGRTVQAFSQDPQGNVQVATTYDGLGRAKRVTNPYRSTTEPTYGYADTAYDLAGRVITVTTSDNSVVTTAYNGARVLVTDQAGKQRISKTDGLSRLTDVWEVTASDSATEPVTFPGSSVAAGYRTTYGYDALDDLVTAKQRIGTTGTLQTRTFSYDGLKRLTQAFNPESGTINYTYDENSDLKTKLDARNITTTYNYDALNRVISRVYTNDPQSTPTVTYKYDGQSLPNGAPTFTRGSSIGRLVSVTSGTGSAGNYTGYDQLGRVNVSYQQTDSINYSFGYGYNLASEMTAETYPSGRQVVTEYDTAGRAAGIRAAAIYYAGATATDTTNRIQYAPQGAVSIMKLGNGKWEHTDFNNRVQPKQIGLGTSGTDSSILKLDYEYTSSCQTGNNGNVLKQTITAPGLGLIQSYCYDALNRLSSASENSGASWSQTYGFDRYGNRWVSASPGFTLSGLTPTSSGAFNAANNRLFASGYDNAGNQTSDVLSRQFTYDAENRQLTFNATGGQYFYDGEGRRVKKVAGSVTTVFVYNAMGELTAEYANDMTPPAGGGGSSYLTSDHLGSTRVVTKSDGSVKARYDYLPFGEELGSGIGGRTTGMGYSAADSTKQKFTQKERDSESGLDYFGARYYSSAQGRFTSADLPLKDQHVEIPQSWNLYPYVRNNPLSYYDDDGRDVKDIRLKVSKENEASKKRSQEAGNVEQLGPKANGGNFVFVVNVIVEFTPDDDPKNYDPKQTAFIVSPAGKNIDPLRPGESGKESADNPEKDNVSRTGNKLIWLDNPGLLTSGAPTASIGSKDKPVQVLELFQSTVKPKDEKKGQGKPTDKILYWGVRFDIVGGKMVNPVAGQITREQYYKLSGQKPPKEKKPNG